jgi:hypothetical protein
MKIVNHHVSASAGKNLRGGTMIRENFRMH